MNPEFGPSRERPSKSQKKRELKAQRSLAVELSGLDSEELRHLGLDTACCESLLEIARIKPSSARNRQIKYATRLLVAQDVEQVEAFLKARRSTGLAEARRHRVLEAWRDRLLVDGDTALAQLREQVPDLNTQALRVVIRQARAEANSGKPPVATRKLYRLLREQLPYQGFDTQARA